MMYNEPVSVPVLATKFFIPPLRSKTILRSRLMDQLNRGLECKLILISASAGFGKTTVVSEWVSRCRQPVVWLSLDEEHSESMRFLTYFITALQDVSKDIGSDLILEIQSPQSPSLDLILSKLMNEIVAINDDFVFILDDYHVTDSIEIDKILIFLLKNMPVQMHLVLITREDPHLPLARLRARGEMVEIRAADLRFTSSEATDFLNQMMNLNLTESDITALETRTEGWIAGLQLAAISMQGQKKSSDFIESFTGSHHYILDYLIEEVLHQQSGDTQSFLIRTSMLDRMCGSLCDSILQNPEAEGQKTLEKLEQLNMFIIPLDNERHWYRYHHLFAELLRQRLQQSKMETVKLHVRASQWYEDHDLYIEAFKHSASAGDLDRTIRLLEGNGIPRHSRTTVLLILNWLQSLPEEIMNGRPLLWITYGSVLLGTGIITGVEEKLLAAEKAIGSVIPDSKTDETTKDLIGRIASTRAILAVTKYDAEVIYAQSVRALKYLHVDNMASRTTSTWTLAQAYEQKGDLLNAAKSYKEAISIGLTSGNYLFAILSEAGLGDLLEAENRLHKASQIYQQVLQQVGKQPLPVLCDVYLGLARIHYQWNDLERAREYSDMNIHLSRKFENGIDRFILADLFAVRLKIASDDLDNASALLKSIANTVHHDNFKHRIPVLAAMQVELKIKQRDLISAAEIAKKHDLSISRVKVLLQQSKPSEALKILDPLFLNMEEEKREFKKLNIMILQILALYGKGEKKKAFHLLEKVLRITEPENFVRIYIDEGQSMFRILSEAKARGMMPEYLNRIVSLFNVEQDQGVNQPLIESLSQRELEVLDLLSLGLSNKEICDKLFLALDTVKGHNRRIYSKLGVKTRTMAISRARSLNILN